MRKKRIAQVWQKLSSENQQLAIDLIANLVSDYYLSQRKGVDTDESFGRKQDSTDSSVPNRYHLHQTVNANAGQRKHTKHQTAI